MHPMLWFTAALVAFAWFVFAGDWSCTPGRFDALKTVPCWIAWLHPWQAMIAGIFAVTAGLFVIASTRLQITATEKAKRDEDTERRDRFRMAILHDAMDLKEHCSMLASTVGERRAAGSGQPVHLLEGLRTEIPATIAADWNVVHYLSREELLKVKVLSAGLRTVARLIDLAALDAKTPNVDSKLGDPFSSLQGLYESCSQTADELADELAKDLPSAFYSD